GGLLGAVGGGDRGQAAGGVVDAVSDVAVLIGRIDRVVAEIVGVIGCGGRRGRISDRSQAVQPIVGVGGGVPIGVRLRRLVAVHVVGVPGHAAGRAGEGGREQ